MIYACEGSSTGRSLSPVDGSVHTTCNVTETWLWRSTVHDSRTVGDEQQTALQQVTVCVMQMPVMLSWHLVDCWIQHQLWSSLYGAFTHAFNMSFQSWTAVAAVHCYRGWSKGQSHDTPKKKKLMCGRNTRDLLQKRNLKYCRRWGRWWQLPCMVTKGSCVFPVFVVTGQQCLAGRQFGTDITKKQAVTSWLQTVWLQFLLRWDTSLCATVGQMLKCQWWLHGGLGLVCTSVTVDTSSIRMLVTLFFWR